MPSTLQERERGENFPVALRFLPHDLRDHLHAIYAIARTIDETGDNLPEGYGWQQSVLRLLDNAATTPEQLEQIRRNGYVLLQRAEDGPSTLKVTKPPARRQPH